MPYYNGKLIQDLRSCTAIPTPYYVTDEIRLRRNLRCLLDIKEQSGARILLAQKAFSMFSLYPIVGEYLDGVTASGLFEARLGYEKMGKENHIFSPAYTEETFDEILSMCGHIVFNSPSQWLRFREKALLARANGVACPPHDSSETSSESRHHPSFGLRINPEHSTQEHGIYDPCSPGSRLGITSAQLTPELMEGIDGLHFHTLCEQNVDALESTLAVVEERFAPYLHELKWLNLGGGHHITREDYDREHLIQIIRYLRETYNVAVYLEPGEAVALNAGFLVSRVVDILENNGLNAILDTSAACHMPDVLEMPYQPKIIGARFASDVTSASTEPSYTYRLGGPSCLAGDVIGEYVFDHPLAIGEPLIFCDMAIYSMVKNNTFNGIPLPAIAHRKESGEIRLVKAFGYEDFAGRLS